MPLWNPYCGLGFPFLADIQSSVFAPLRLVFDFAPGLRTYNIYLILQVLCCLLSSYSLARALKLGAFASMFAAIAYTFCPYNLWYLELNLSAAAMLFPLTALAFVWAGKKQHLGSAILAGFASALLILSGHPECSFFGVTLSSLLLCLVLVFGSPDGFGQKCLSCLKILLTAAVVTIAAAAPALFPFLEYLLNCQSYKYGPSYSTPVSVQGILFNLANPGAGGASPFLGIIAAILIPFALLGLSKKSKMQTQSLSILLLSLICFLLVSQLGPLQSIFARPPLTAVITRYALPYLLMLLALLSGLGLDRLKDAFDKLSSRSRRQDLVSSKITVPAILCSLILLPAVYFAFSFCAGQDPEFMKAADFDAMLARTALSIPSWRRDLICSLIFFGTATAAFFQAKDSRQHKARLLTFLSPACLVGAAALVLSFVSIASVAKGSLPLQADFFYPQTEVLSKLQDPMYRTISTCEHLLRPATNAVYQINFLSVHNPLFPKRFLKFMKACGAETDMFNQKFSNKISNTVDLASVKYVLSLEDLESAPGAGAAGERFHLSYLSNNNIRIYENNEAAPRVYLVVNADYVRSAEDALARIQDPAFNPKLKVVIESNSPPAPGAAEADNSENNPAYVLPETFKQIDANTLYVACQCKQASWLVLTDIHYPGWQAYVDGAKVEIERANYAFRGIALSPGKHEITFVYQPLSYILGCAAALILFLICVMSIKLGFWKHSLER